MQSALRFLLLLPALVTAGCAPTATGAPPTPSVRAVADPRPTPDPDPVRWTVAAHRVPCSGVGRMTCLRYRDTDGGPWRLLYGPIEGFEFREGFETDLLVRFVQVPKPPADGSSRRVVMVRELARRAVPPSAMLPPVPGPVALHPERPSARIRRASEDQEYLR